MDGTGNETQLQNPNIIPSLPIINGPSTSRGINCRYCTSPDVQFLKMSFTCWHISHGKKEPPLKLPRYLCNKCDNHFTDFTNSPVPPRVAVRQPPKGPLPMPSGRVKEEYAQLELEDEDRDEEPNLNSGEQQ